MEQGCPHYTKRGYFCVGKKYSINYKNHYTNLIALRSKVGSCVICARLGQLSQDPW